MWSCPGFRTHRGGETQIVKQGMPDGLGGLKRSFESAFQRHGAQSDEEEKDPDDSWEEEIKMKEKRLQEAEDDLKAEYQKLMKDEAIQVKDKRLQYAEDFVNQL